MELAGNGKARLVPVTIMINGRFYDAGVYKADPVPMALEAGTVYEALKTGVPQGLFTVAGALRSDARGWVGDGQWRTTAEIEAEKAKTKAQREKLAQKSPPPEGEIGSPPKLRRGSEPSKSGTTQNPHPAPPKSQTDADSRDQRAPAPTQAAPRPSEDANRPILRRQAPSETTHEQTKSGGESEPLQGALQYLPAISDAGGADPRPYAYQMKPEEEQGFLKNMLAMAAEEVRTRASAVASSKLPSTKTAPKLQSPQLRVFDLANNNEAVPVLTATATVPGSDLSYNVAVIARQDIYGDLHKVFASTTDNQHLDVVPKYELIDAVDANGDGAGELLFRVISDTGTTYNVYRVIGDRLWPLFEGRPGS